MKERDKCMEEDVKSFWIVGLLVGLFALSSAPAQAMVGQRVDTKVLGFENSNVRVQGQYWEYVVDSKKISPDSIKALRMAKKDEPVSFLLPMDAVISKKKIKHKKHASKGKKGGKK